MKRPAVILQPHAGRHLLRGLDVIANALRPTLGPLARSVAFQSTPNRAPEVLREGAAIARRIDTIGDGPADAGAMLLRSALREMTQRVGDGAVTAAVLAQALARRAHRLIAAGAHPMLLQRGIRLAVDAVAAALRAQSFAVAGKVDLTRAAQSFCGDNELARILGEVYSVVGSEGDVDIQAANGRVVERSYVEGACWRTSGWLSSAFAEPGARHAILEDAAVVLIDGWVMKTDGLGRIIDQALGMGYRSICVVCLGMSEVNRGILAHNHNKGNYRFLPIQTPYHSTDREYMLEDIAVLTGAQVLGGSFEPILDGFTPDMIGAARRVWAEASQCGLVGGLGDPKALRAHISRLRKRLALTSDKQEQGRLRKRLGRLMGGTAVVQVGAPTETERKVRQAMADRCARYLRSVAGGGMAPGGGAAYLACQRALSSLASEDDDVAAGIDCVRRALEEPMRAIAGNAGVDPTATVLRARACGDGFGLDARTGQIVEMRRHGILDSAEVLEQALRTAASVSSMLLSTDVIVRRRKPPVDIDGWAES